jgi:predicted regulator of Ras-like GTPase activity (Roadblock/LC7/MglB family)
VQRQDMDWILKDLAAGVPQTRHVVVLSADGLRIAELSTVEGDDSRDAADRISAACSALQSLAAALANELPHGSGRMRMVAIEMEGGFFYLMAAGPGAYLGVLADEDVDPKLMGSQMRDLVKRIGEHLSSAPRSGET